MLLFILELFVLFCYQAYAKDETVSIGKVLEKLSELENIITSQNQELRQLKENERNLLQRIQNLEHKHALKERDLENQSLSVTVQKRAPSEPVAFYAYMSSGEQNPGQHQTMAFDHVVTNIASAYNKYTGIFTVPVTGLYVLTITLSGSPSSQIPLQFTRNNEILGAIDLFAASGSVDTNPTVSSTIVVSLSKGDSCFIRTSASYTTAGTIYSTDLSRSSFAGWLVSAS
ncbi:complement C1q-like protein 3 [Mytilus edulis]|uniref:C1q domain-containing protein n=1 Tax=Mytilus galloprovincialis TaxID=29158 RepID=A0A8B6BMU0_MYTGA|nr:Hypothetical predicted protein [Mytilus galloprovincialis]